MKIRVIGAGVYGCHIATALLADGHDVTVFDKADRIFAGASGNCPARLHLGATHYPRSGATQASCRSHGPEFMRRYGFLTRHVETNIYAVADKDSLVDFTAYRDVLKAAGIEFVTVRDPAEYGLSNVEGAVIVAERHIVADAAAKHFEEVLGDRIRLGEEVEVIDDPAWDLTVDCTFCATGPEGVDRYEPCLTLMLEGPTSRSVTVVDGPFCGIYVWNEDLGLSTLTSASLTPLSKTCRTYSEAAALLADTGDVDLAGRAAMMMDQMESFMPALRGSYRVAGFRTAIRAMPRSGADSRLVAVSRVGERAVKVRAGKMDAIFEAERAVMEMLP